MSQASLYEGVIPGGITLDRGPKPWVSAAFEPRWLITAIAVALITVQMISWRRMVIAIGMAVAGGLTTADVTYGLMYNHLTIDDLIINVAANILGAISVSAVFFLILWMSLWVSSVTGIEGNGRQMVTGTLTATFGISGSLIMYVATATLLQPIEVKARVLAKLPTKGVIGQKYTNAEEREEGNGFRFIGDRTKIEYVALAGVRGLDWEWRQAEEGTRFAATVYVVEGCSEVKEVKELTDLRPVTTVADVERLRITVDDFVTEFVLEGSQIGVSVERGPVSQFWLKRNNKGSGVDLTEFLVEVPNIRGNTRGDIAILLTAPTSQHDDQSGVKRRAPRTVRVRLNDETVPIVFDPTLTVNDGERLTCRSLEQNSESTRKNTYENVRLAGLYAEIERTRVPRSYWARFDGKSLVSQRSTKQIRLVSTSGHTWA